MEQSTRFIRLDIHKCSACLRCIGKCPVAIIDKDSSPALTVGKVVLFRRKYVAFTDVDKCIGCMRCIAVCPHKAFQKI